jgi:hypothetical protein
LFFGQRGRQVCLGRPLARQLRGRRAGFDWLEKIARIPCLFAEQALGCERRDFCEWGRSPCCCRLGGGDGAHYTASTRRTPRASSMHRARGDGYLVFCLLIYQGAIGCPETCLSESKGTRPSSKPWLGICRPSPDCCCLGWRGPPQNQLYDNELCDVSGTAQKETDI